MSGNKVVKFFQKNVVMISGIGIIIATHWGWSQLQHNPNLVPEDKRKELPIIIGLKHLSNEAMEIIKSFSSSETSGKAVEKK